MTARQSLTATLVLAMQAQLLHPRERIRYFLASVAACTSAEIWRRPSRQTSANMSTRGCRRDAAARHRRRSSRRRRYAKNNGADPTVLFRSARVRPIGARALSEHPRRDAGRPSKSRAQCDRHRSRFSAPPRPEGRNFCNVANRSRRYHVCGTVSRFPEINSLLSDCSPARYAPKSRGERTKWVPFSST